MELGNLHADVLVFYGVLGGGIFGVVELLEGGSGGVPLCGEVGVCWAGEVDYVLVSGVYSEVV